MISHYYKYIHIVLHYFYKYIYYYYCYYYHCFDFIIIIIIITTTIIIMCSHCWYLQYHNFSSHIVHRRTIPSIQPRRTVSSDCLSSSRYAGDGRYRQFYKPDVVHSYVSRDLSCSRRYE